MPAKPKPIKVEKTFEDKLKRSRWCVKHKCYKWVCHPHKPSKAKPRKPIVSKKPIRIKARAERRKFTQSERTQLEKELDRLCSLYVRKRDGKCVTCGTTENLTCSHFIKRANQFVRYDVNVNLNTQCARCNDAHNTDEDAYELYLLRNRGRAVVAHLRTKATVKYFAWSVPELREMVDDMKAKLESL